MSELRIGVTLPGQGLRFAEDALADLLDRHSYRYDSRSNPLDA